MSRVFLVPIDFGPCSIYALQWTAKNVLRDGDQVVLFHCVQDDLDMVDTDFTGKSDVDALTRDVGLVGAPVKAAESQMDAANENIDKWADTLKNNLCKGIKINVTCDVQHDSAPGPLILSKIKQYQPSTVIMGSHNRGVLSEFFMGSVSKYCLQGAAGIPVVVVNMHE